MIAFEPFGSSEGILLPSAERPNPSVKGTSRKRVAPYVER
jgi:hypothetical protein